MTPTPSADTLVKRALAGHASIGLLAGALIYLLAMTGAMIVVHDRWQRWEQPAIAESATLLPAAAQRSLKATLALEQGLPRTEHVYIRMPTADLPRAVVTTDNKAWYIDGAGEVAGREAHTWTEFVMALHINLTLPIVWGMILVGALGVGLAALLVTGVLAHPRIIRDAFRLRTRHDPQLARADWHNRLGVWTLLPMLAITLTGAYIGLSYAGAGVLAQAYEKGEIDPVYATIFGEEPAHDPAPAPLPNIARALETMQREYPETFPTYVVIHDPMTRGQFVQVIAEHPRRLIYGETYKFSSAGNLLGHVGTSDGSAGRQAAASTYKLHFGDYGGLAVELAYIVFGLALAGITATGTTLWLRKRERQGLPSVRLAAAWSITIWGIPLLLILTALARLSAGPDFPMIAMFWGLWALAVVVASYRPAVAEPKRLMRILGLALAATAIAHQSWFQNMASGNLAINMILLATGVIIYWLGGGRFMKLRGHEHQHSRQPVACTWANNRRSKS